MMETTSSTLELLVLLPETLGVGGWLNELRVLMIGLSDGDGDDKMSMISGSCSLAYCTARNVVVIESPFDDV